MSATFVNFTPSTAAPFSFQAQLGNEQYSVAVTWNVVGQRYYISVSDLSGNVLLYRPLIATGPQLIASFEWANGFASATTQLPHSVPLGSTVNVYISQTDTAFDGAYQAFATGPNTLSYTLTENPDEATPINGAVNFTQNLIASIIDGAYLIFSYQTQQFEYG